MDFSSEYRRSLMLMSQNAGWKWLQKCLPHKLFYFSAPHQSFTNLAVFVSMFRNFCVLFSMSRLLILAVLTIAIFKFGLKHNQNCIKHNMFLLCCIWSWSSLLFSAGLGLKVS